MVKGVTTSIITVAVLMGSLVACGDFGSSQNSGNAVLSLDEKIYYSDYCEEANYNCQSEIEQLAQRIFGGTEEEKQSYLSAFTKYIDCKINNFLFDTEVSEQMKKANSDGRGLTTAQIVRIKRNAKITIYGSDEPSPDCKL